jgi:hypothetical protein
MPPDKERRPGRVTEATDESSAAGEHSTSTIPPPAGTELVQLRHGYTALYVLDSAKRAAQARRVTSTVPVGKGRTGGGRR